MANPKYSTQNIQSNILAYESLCQYGFCRKAATATANADLGTFPIDNSTNSLILGTVVYFDTDKWIPYSRSEVITGDPLGTATAIVIGTNELGEALGDLPSPFESGDVGGMLLTNGMAIVRGQYLSSSPELGPAPSVQDFTKLIESAMVQVKVYESQEPFNGSYNDETSITN